MKVGGRSAGDQPAAGFWEPAGGLDARAPRPQIARRPTSYERAVKPLLDRVLAGLLVLPLLPALAVVSLVVLVSLGRPVLLRQPRVGLGGRVFPMLKFRTMSPDRREARLPYVGADRRVVHKHPDDPRHTRVGRFLRRWSLDELPQLLNVLRGDLSLVGPRPELVDIVDRYEPWQHRRHDVKPGLTGLWQVTARDAGVMHEHVEIDLAYLERLCLRTDVEILLRTVPAVLGSRQGR